MMPLQQFKPSLLLGQGAGARDSCPLACAKFAVFGDPLFQAQLDPQHAL
jgi:hypothetical protein